MLQVFLLLLAFGTVPFLLCAKPCILNRQQKAKKKDDHHPLPEDEEEGGHHHGHGDHGGHEEHGESVRRRLTGLSSSGLDDLMLVVCAGWLQASAR